MKFVTLTTDASLGGSSISLINFLVALKTQGHDVLVILPVEGKLSHKLREQGIKFLTDKYLSLSIYPSLCNLRDIIAFPYRLMRLLINKSKSQKFIDEIIKEYKPDVIHSNVSLFTDGYVLARKHNIPHIWHLREYGDKDFNLNFFPSKKRRKIILNNSYCIAITKGLKNEYELGEKCRVLYNGIISVKEPLIIEEQKEPYFLYVGKVSKEKGVEELIKSYTQYLKRNGKIKSLILLGTYESEFLREMKSLYRDGFEIGNIIFKGQVDDVSIFMRNAICQIVPSPNEGFGRITAEAMSLGCLVIGKNTAGTKEQFDNGLSLQGEEIGIRYISSESLERAMHEVEEMSTDIYKEYLQRAYATVSSLYEVEETNENITKFIEKVVSKK